MGLLSQKNLLSITKELNMNFQDTTNLSIPEGEVRTIHNSSNQLLWGRLNYDAKYSGDTTQQTYTGKNLFDINNTSGAVRATKEISGNSIKVTATANNTGYIAIIIPNSDSLLGKQCTISCNSQSSTGTPRLRVFQAPSSNPPAGEAVTLLDGSGDVSRTFTFPSAYNTNRDCFTILLYPHSDVTPFSTGDYATYTNIQLEIGGSKTSFEPYCGGVPAPNPSFPMPVDVVTGTQTISITDGTNTQNFTVNLGSTELAKIGNYQDYVYKSGDDWYVHKAVGKVVLDGTQTLIAHSTVHNFYANGVVIGAQAPSSLGISYFVSDREAVAQIGNVTAFNTNYSNLDYCFAIKYETLGIVIRDTRYSTASDLQTWYSSHPGTIYYALDTPTDTKITDSTLISQLNSVHQWLVRYGYNATVSGNIPIVINRTNL